MDLTLKMLLIGMKLIGPSIFTDLYMLIEYLLP